MDDRPLCCPSAQGFPREKKGAYSAVCGPPYIRCLVLGAKNRNSLIQHPTFAKLFSNPPIPRTAMSSPALTSASEISLAFNTPTNDILFDPELINTRIYEWNARHNPNYPIFVFHDGKEPKYITYATAYKAIVRAAQYVHSFAYASSKKTRRPVVAIIANTGTFCELLFRVQPVSPPKYHRLDYLRQHHPRLHQGRRSGLHCLTS